ncbi:MAG: molybdopterin-dependent oxidoreductase, partial [Phycisphaerae bacterium]|nr:molybdopterin-dependent oxidoreductase [Phycisphaerae bacterium]
VIAADTDTTPVDIGSWISGNTYVTGNATRMAATEVRRKLMDIAAEKMEIATDDLVMANKAVHVVGS